VISFTLPLFFLDTGDLADVDRDDGHRPRLRRQRERADERRRRGRRHPVAGRVRLDPRPLGTGSWTMPFASPSMMPAVGNTPDDLPKSPEIPGIM
jgi:hypothetical protein